MHILAVSNNGKLTQIGLYPTDVTIDKIVVSDGYAYLAVGQQGIGLWMFRIRRHHVCSIPLTHLGMPRSDCNGPILWWPTMPVYRSSIYPPTEPTTVATYDTADCAHKVVSAGGQIYVLQPLGGCWFFA
ncbi:MAG: hypothetical protein R2867_07285 [Caldilineaceae bacterium]